MKVRHHPFDNNTLGENTLSQIKIILAKTYRVVKPDLEGYSFSFFLPIGVSSPFHIVGGASCLAVCSSAIHCGFLCRFRSRFNRGCRGHLLSV